MLLTLALEALLSKQRILEIYLNSVEWGEGVFGAEAAAQHYFRKSASRLGTTEAARKPSGPTAAQIAAAAHAAAVMTAAPAPVADSQDIPAEEVHEVDGDEHVSSSIDEQRGSVDASEALEVTPALAVDAEPAQASPDVVDTADDVAEAVAEAVAHDLEKPVVRPKRRRGRVVAPAGPPRAGCCCHHQ